jgi:hypothetical protein
MFYIEQTTISNFTVIDKQKKKKMTYRINQNAKEILFLCRCKRCIINIRYYSYLEQCFITFFQVLVQSYICSLYYLFILLKYVLLVLYFFIISATSITHKNYHNMYNLSKFKHNIHLN